MTAKQFAVQPRDTADFLTHNNEFTDDSLGSTSDLRFRCAVAAGIVAIVSILLKLLIATEVPASATFADDYNALNRARFFIEGIIHPKPQQYPSPLVPAGVTHHLLIAPWVYFDFPARLYFVFGVNALLSAIYIFAGSLTVFRLTGRASPLIPVALAALTPTVVFNFYAMTENLVFALVAILSYFVAEFSHSIAKRQHFALLVAVVALLPITRTPGLSVLGPLVLLLWIYRTELGRATSVTRIGWLILVTAGVYLLYMDLMASHREAKYTGQLSHFLAMVNSWPILGRLFLSQLAYILVTTGGWIVPLILLLPFDPAWKNSSRQFKDTYLFCALTSLCFVLFCLVHNLLKMQATGGNGWFIYGRYDDPATVLLTILGFAAVFLIPPLHWRTKILVGIMTFVLTAVSLYCLADTKWVPINATGLSFFSVKRTSLTDNFLIAVVFVASSIWFLPRSWKVGPSALLLVFLAFNLASAYHGMVYTSQRAKGIAFATEGASWLNANTSKNDVLCFDAAVTSQKAIGATKRMGNVYIAMMFNTYPLQTYMLRNSRELSRCSYIYSLKDRVPHFQLPLVWSNDGYAVIDARNPARETQG